MINCSCDVRFVPLADIRPYSTTSSVRMSRPARLSDVVDAALSLLQCQHCGGGCGVDVQRPLINAWFAISALGH
jgi:hypothetical protein